MDRTHAERIAALNELDIFLPLDTIRQTHVPIILWTVALLTVTYLLCFYFVGYVVAKDSTLQKRRKVCYQMTNLLFNSMLGATGLYYEFVLAPSEYSIEEAISGFQAFLPISCFQLGYQAFAIPTGILFADESAAMLCHHVAVVLVAVMSGFMNNGFRSWTPFFYGILEISSVPLAIMNTFKDNPTWIKKQPIVYLMIRVVFAVSFLFIRIWMLVPRKMAFLRDHYLLFSTSPIWLYRVYMSFVWLASFFLSCLQFYWASIIIKGMINQFGGKARRSKKKQI